MSELTYERAKQLYTPYDEGQMRHLCALRDVEIDRLRVENAKLRELVRFIMHQCNDGNPRCDECIGWNDGECVALLRMRELGVEVES